MAGTTRAFSLVAALLLVVLSKPGGVDASDDVGNGFAHHGVATPVSNHRGTVATIDGQGRRVVLVWLFDHRGGYALLSIDAQSGSSQQIPVPFPPGGDCPYASILSSANRYYTHFNSHFVEYDPAVGQFTFHRQTARQMAMSMTEDDQGVIWSVTYPDSGLVSYDPKTKSFRDFGHLHRENWRQYPRSIAADDTGWVYFGIGSTLSHIMGFDPAASEAKEMIAQDQRTQGYAEVFRAVDGKVYGHVPPDSWFVLYKGHAEKLGVPPRVARKQFISGSQGLFHTRFPDGSRLASCDLVEREMAIVDAGTEQARRVSFDYTSEGADIMGMAAAPDGTICGGTAFPMRFFAYDPRTEQWTNRESYGQWNTVARQGDHFFVGGYGGGFSLDWDPARPWVNTVKGEESCNPRFLTQSAPTINRPHELLAHSDGTTLVLAGTPGYGYTGGGLLFWDRQTGSRTLLEHTDLIAQHSTMSLAALPDRQLLGGTTTAAGTGGERKAEQAELYILDMASKKLVWHQPLIAGVQAYTDLCRGPRGLVYGVADNQLFFVFDPARRQVVHQQAIGAALGRTVSQQGPRALVPGPGDTVYLLLVRGVAQIDPQTFVTRLLARSPVPIAAGGDLHHGRIYFASGSHLYSYQVPQ